MKIECSECGATAHGNQDQLSDKGWNRMYGWRNGGYACISLCPKCMNPEKMCRMFATATDKAAKEGKKANIVKRLMK